MDNIKTYIEYVARFTEVIGVITIAFGAVIALIGFSFTTPGKKHSYKILRQNLGKAILLGLEILVAADIIATVVTEPTLDQVLTLSLIVLIRTFLSFSLQIELEGKLPWQRNNRAEDEEQ